MKIVFKIGLIVLLTALSGKVRSLPIDRGAFDYSNFAFDIPYITLSNEGTLDASQVALKFIKDKFGLTTADLIITSVVPTDTTGITSVYLRQRVNGINVGNANINVNIDKKGHVISYGENIFRGEKPNPPNLSYVESENQFGMTPIDAFRSLIAHLSLPQEKGPLHIEKTKISTEEAVHKNIPAYIIRKPVYAKNDIPVRFAYMKLGNELNLVLVYSYELELENNWYHAHVNTNDGKVVRIVDWVSNAVYKVLNIDDLDPLHDERRLIIPDLRNRYAPFGWHSNGTDSYLDTRGNNVWAQENINGRKNIQNLYRPTGGSNLTFIFPFYRNKEPPANKDAAITQLFYVINSLHDILYVYGFNEVAGNFQNNNANKGGIGDDFVVANAESQLSTNNANFATPPDGQSGVLNMYLFTLTTPKRDSIFDLSVIIHEYGHGLSNRLTGGPNNSDCLGWGESGGMGEGWSDVLAVLFRQQPTNNRNDSFFIGSYMVGDPGVRQYPYSTFMHINPLLYSFLNKNWEVHAVGEIWASILLEVYWNLVDTLGFTSDFYSASTSKGNTLFLHLIINGMKLQPCGPRFLQARDAIIQAEKALTKGVYRCQLWKGFAKRGLGIDAQKPNPRVKDGFALPPECNDTN